MLWEKNLGEVVPPVVDVPYLEWEDPIFIGKKIAPGEIANTLVPVKHVGLRQQVETLKHIALGAQKRMAIDLIKGQRLKVVDDQGQDIIPDQ